MVDKQHKSIYSSTIFTTKTFCRLICPHFITYLQVRDILLTKSSVLLHFQWSSSLFWQCASFWHDQ